VCHKIPRTHALVLFLSHLLFCHLGHLFVFELQFSYPGCRHISLQLIILRLIQQHLGQPLIQHTRAHAHVSWLSIIFFSPIYVMCCSCNVLQLQCAAATTQLRYSLIQHTEISNLKKLEHLLESKKFRENRASSQATTPFLMK